MGTWGILIQFGGLVIILIAFVDIFLTVLQGGNVSLISSRFIRLIWWLFCRAAIRVPRYRSRILSYGGPTLIPAIINMWALMISLGFALIFMPAMGTHIVSPEGNTDTGFLPALYFSIMSIVTLGNGDFVATNNLYRMLDIFGTLSGFTILTAAIGYLMSVYAALTRHRGFALSLEHATGDHGTSIDLMTKLGAGGNFSDSRSTMENLATEMVALIEAHHTYTVLRYFRPRGNAYALPRIAFVVLDTASLIRSAIDRERYHPVVQSTSVAMLWGGGMQMVHELADVLAPDDVERHSERYHDDERVWRKHFADALDRFREEGIAITNSPEEAADHYVELRREWQSYISAFGAYLMYDERAIHPGESD